MCLREWSLEKGLRKMAKGGKIYLEKKKGHSFVESLDRPRSGRTCHLKEEKKGREE